MERHAKRARRGNGEPRNLKTGSRAYSDGTNPWFFVSCEATLLTTAGNNEAEGIEDSLHSLEDIGIIELLEQDSRPTFIIDLPSDIAVKGQMNVVFCNTSLRFFDNLRNVVCAEAFYPVRSQSSSISTESISDQVDVDAELNFKTWATSRAEDSSDGYLPRHTFQNMFWTCSTLRGRWRVVSASQVPNQLRESHGTPKLSHTVSRSAPSTTDAPRPEKNPEFESQFPEEAKLSKKLADTESRFRVLTELNPAGMYYLSPDGTLEYANDMCKLIHVHV